MTLEMDLSVRGPSILLNTLQQPLPGTVLYPTKNSPWQAVVAPLPALNLCTEIPKESIIANTDFTTTSVIAKRRLSSKKRRQQQQDSGSCSSTSLAAESPTTQSPSVSSTLPSPVDKMETSRENPVPSSHFTSPSSSSSSASSSSSLFKHHVAHTHAQHLPTAIAAPNYSVPLIPMAGSGVPVTAHQPAPVYAPVQTELALKMLHEQTISPLQHTTPAHSQNQGVTTSSVWAQPRPSDAMPPVPTSSQQQGSDFKWCSAHVFIAKRIREHQQQRKDVAEAGSSKDHHVTHHSAVTQLTLAQLDAVQQQQQQQLQQMALLQMYGALPTLPNLMATGPVVTGLTDTQHLMPGAVTTGVVGNLAPPTTSGHPTHLIGVQIPAVYPHHGVPMAIAPVELNAASSAALIQAHNGSWAAPVPVIGSCVVNPIQPGMMVTSWVK